MRLHCHLCRPHGAASQTREKQWRIHNYVRVYRIGAIAHTDMMNSQFSGLGPLP
jgi:hypothetical protein